MKRHNSKQFKKTVVQKPLDGSTGNNKFLEVVHLRYRYREYTKDLI